MKIIKNIFLFILLLFAFASCNNKVDINAEYQDITIVYGLLDPSETRHFIKLTKAFQTEGNVYLGAKDSSLSQYDYDDIEVYIDDQLNYYIQDQAHRVEKEQLQPAIAAALGGAENGSVMLKVDQSVAVQYVVNVIDAVNKINVQDGHNYKVVLATKPE